MVTATLVFIGDEYRDKCLKVQNVSSLMWIIYGLKGNYANKRIRMLLKLENSAQ